VARLGQVRLVALGLQAQWRRRAATRIVTLLRLWRRAASRIVASLQLEDAEKRHVRLVARAGAARAVQRSWRRACRVAWMRVARARLVQQAFERQELAEFQARYALVPRRLRVPQARELQAQEAVRQARELLAQEPQEAQARRCLYAAGRQQQQV